MFFVWLVGFIYLFIFSLIYLFIYLFFFTEMTANDAFNYSYLMAEKKKTFSGLEKSLRDWYQPPSVDEG